MPQGVQTDATFNIQQCCVRLHGALSTTICKLLIIFSPLDNYNSGDNILLLTGLDATVPAMLLNSISSLSLCDEVVRNCNSFSLCVFFSSLQLNLYQIVPCLALPNSILDGFSDFKFSTQLVSTVVVAAITVFQVRF